MNRRLMSVAFALVLATGVACADNPVTIGEGIVVPPRMVSSRILGEERAVYIALPVSYARTQRHYPVLYLTDAVEKFMHTQATAAFLARNGLMPEVIIVAVGNTDRPRDLTPSKNEARPTSGGADRFLEFFEKELIPYVESHYRTAPFRIFAGHSLGGLFALHSMRAKPGLFDAVIAVSPWLQWDGRKEQALLTPFFAGDGVKTRVLFYASGNEGKAMSEGVEALAKGLELRKGNGLRVGSANFPNENHGSVVLPAHYAAFRMIFEGWAMPLDAAGKGSPVTLGSVRKYYAGLGERLGLAIVPPEATVNDAGFAALEQQDVPDAVDLFRFNAATYPESPAVWAGLGEALTAKEDLPGALESFSKAEAIGKATGEPRTPLYHAAAEKVRAEMEKNASAR